MKTKILLLAAMTFTLAGFSQKAEIKAADKALKGGDAMAAKSSLESAASLIEAADDKTKGLYYFLRGKTYADLAKKGDATAFSDAATSFNKLIDLEATTGKAKYTDEANQHVASLVADLVNAAVEDNNNNKYKEAGEKLYMGYKLSPKDTSYLYYASSSAVNGGHYEDALKYYDELKEIGYDGGGVKYTALNVASGEREEMDQNQRDLYVKAGTHSDPLDEKIPSKKAEIVKNMALIYSQLGQDDKAMEAYKIARADNPGDVNLILNEANLHYKLGDKDKFKVLMAEAADLAPENADLHYNIGVINMEQGLIEEARASYKKALEIKPDYVNAQLNLSTTYVNEGNGLIDEMNELSTSRKRADLDKYDELKQKKDDLFLVAASVLEDALKVSADNQAILNQLKNIYGALGDNDNFMRIKGLLEE
ncbi:tetratricopeptide (TPR) repeat protein [Saonia flava]|uniref:Tetratricopeptide (TPR) repeat protein n=1 Tax=Saonia flava TaxID=523696 RepID=A0A846QZ53_9FLAO|nr:tetratricopeptide repeat protein [Saonia flava]NJB70414.1 tetratricopeptide (TPR) repeat protein [Saonia flava]